MTHDELLARLYEYKSSNQGLFEMTDLYQWREALRAVVELHKPWDVETEGGTFTLCNDCSRRVDLPGYGILYPCKTIYTIEEQLK